jgi:trigger factor
MATSIKKLPHSQIELHFTLDPVHLEVAREAALAAIASQVKVPGFRPGKAPRKLLEERVNPTAAMQQALDEVLNEAFQEALREHTIIPVAQPAIDISSTDLTKPIEVTAVVQVRPDITVGAWQKITVAKEATSIDDKKVDETLATIFERSQKEQLADKKEGGLVDAQGNALTKTEHAMDDTWAKTLGVNGLAELRTQVKTDLASHAQYEAESGWQDKVMEEIIKLTTADVPQAFIDDELNRMRSQFEQQLSSLQVTMVQYLEQSGKTQEQMEAQWQPQAVKQALLEVALAEIARQDKVEITDEQVEAELAKVDAKVRVQFNDPQQRQYLAYSLWRQNVLKHILETVEKNSREAPRFSGRLVEE